MIVVHLGLSWVDTRQDLVLCLRLQLNSHYLLGDPELMWLLSCVHPLLLLRARPLWGG